MRDQGPTNGRTSNDCRFGPASFYRRPARNITGPVDPSRMKPVSHESIGVWRVGSGPVRRCSKSHGSGRVEISRVESGRVKRCSKCHGSTRVGSGRIWVFSNYGSARVVFEKEISRVRPGWIGRGGGQTFTGWVSSSLKYKNLTCRFGSGPVRYGLSRGSVPL